MTNISLLIQHHAGPTGDVLICSRGDGIWEFPHGPQSTGETEAEAAERIAWETVGMQIVVGKRTMVGHKKPANGSVEHIACGNITHNTHTKCDYHNYYEAVNRFQVQPSGSLYTEYRWVHPSLLGQYTFAGDDENFMAKYDPWINGRTVPDRRMF